MTDQLDLSEYKSANGAAKAVGRKLSEIAEDLSQKPDLEVTVEKRTKRHGDQWIVSWPGGPRNWAIKIMGNEPILAGEPELTGHIDSTGFKIEVENGTMLAFYEK